MEEKEGYGESGARAVGVMGGFASAHQPLIYFKVDIKV